MNNKICFVFFYTSSVLHFATSDNKLEENNGKVNENNPKMSADEIVVAFQPENKILNKLKDEDDADDEENQVAEPDADSDKTIEILGQDEEYDERNELEEAGEENDIIQSDEENDQENNESVKPDDESNEKNELLKAEDDTLNDMVQEAKTAGDYADLFGTNQHYNIPDTYQDFGRRFVLNYPYFEKKPSSEDAAVTELDNAIKQHLAAKKLSDRRLLPHKAPPEFVLAIAKQSVLLESMKPKKPANKIKRKDILRTGDYWDDVWKEDVDVNKVLRSSNTNQNELESVRVKISPGSKLYDLISILQKKSPRLLYVINKRNYE